MDITGMILETDADQCCPLCDNPIMNGEGWDVVTAHGAVLLVHSGCIAEFDDEDDDEDEEAEPSDD